MTRTTAKRLMSAARDLGTENVSVSSSYSGRGMFGTTTYSITIPNVGTLAMLAAMARCPRSKREEFAIELGELRQDNMGRDIVVY